MLTSRMDVKGGMRLIGFGDVVGSYSDFLFGDSTRTTEEMQIRSSYVPDACIDWDFLYNLRGATHNNPFRTSTIKYHVKSTPYVTAVGVRLRDLVVLDCTGETTLPRSTFLDATQSKARCEDSCLALPLFVLREQTRWKSTCACFVKWVGLCHGATRTRNSRGWSSSNVAMVRGAYPLLARRIGARCVRRPSLLYERRQSAIFVKSRSARNAWLSARSATFHVRPVPELVQVSTRFCKHCIMQASLTDAADIARKEYVSSDDASGSAVKSWASRNDSSRPTHSDSLYTIGSYGSFSSTSSSLVDLHVESVEDWEQAQTNPHGTVYSQSPVTADEYQTQILRKMEQLRLTAEQTYQLAKKNERAHAWLVDTL